MINYNDLDVIVDAQGLPVSQYFSEEHGEFAVETTDGSLVLRSDVDFRLKRLILDSDGFPLPQLWDPEQDKFVPRTKLNGSGGGSEVILNDTLTSNSTTQAATASVAKRLDEKITGITSIVGNKDYEGDDTVLLQQAINENYEKTLTLENGKIYYISSPLFINNRITLDLGTSEIRATRQMESIIQVRNNSLFRGLRIKNGKLNANNFSNYSLLISDVASCYIDDVEISNAKVTNVKLSNKGVSGQCYEVFMNNIYLRNNPAVSPNNIGLHVDTADCHFSNIVLVDFKKSVINNGKNFYERVHGWNYSQSIIKESVFFTLESGCHISNSYADTYYIDFHVKTNGTTFITNCTSFYNENAYSLETLNSPMPYKFFFEDNVNTDNVIRIENSSLQGMTKWGGYVTNRKDHVRFISMSNCSIGNLKHPPMDIQNKNVFSNNFNDNDVSVFKNTENIIYKNSLAKVKLSNGTVKAEMINGNFVNSDGWEVHQSSGVTNISVENNEMIVTPGGRYGGVKTSVSVKKGDFVYFRAKVKATNNITTYLSNSSVSSVNVENNNGSYKVFSAIYQINNDGNTQINFSSNGATTNSPFSLKEVVFVNITKSKFNKYFMDTINSVKSKIDYLCPDWWEGTKDIPLGNDEILIKSIPSKRNENFIYQDLLNETQISPYPNGLKVTTNTGTSSNKNRSFNFGITVIDTLKGSFYINSIVERINKLDIVNRNVGSADMYVNGVWRGIKYRDTHHKQKVELKSNDNALEFRLLCSVSNSNGGEVFSFTDFYISESPNDEVYTIKIKPSDGFVEIPVYEKGYLCISPSFDGQQVINDIEIIAPTI